MRACVCVHVCVCVQDIYAIRALKSPLGIEKAVDR